MTETNMNPNDVTPDTRPIQVGDMLYAVGPAHNPPHSAMDLLVYSTPVAAVRPSCPANLCASAVLSLELDAHRPYLGFPKWVYMSYEVGISVHRSRAEALQAFAEHARCRRDQAERARDRAAQEVQWALTAAAETSTEIDP